MTATLTSIADELTPTVIVLIRAHAKAEGDLKKYYWYTLKYMIRHLEWFVVPRVSVNAQTLADSEGLGDLTQYRWRDQPTKMRDRGRKKYHWEHAFAVSDAATELVRLSDDLLTHGAVKSVLLRANVAWITKKQNDCLERYRRQDWQKSYTNAGIELIPISN